MLLQLLIRPGTPALLPSAPPRALCPPRTGLNAILTLALYHHCLLSLLTPRSALAAKIIGPCQKVAAECDFFFAGSQKGVPVKLSAQKNFKSPAILYTRKVTTFAQIYINASDQAPCKTTAAPYTCYSFKVVGGKRPPLPGEPRILLAKRDSATLNAVRGQCFRMYFGEFSIVTGIGPGAVKFIPWDDRNHYYPRNKRCIMFEVA